MIVVSFIAGVFVGAAGFAWIALRFNPSKPTRLPFNANQAFGEVHRPEPHEDQP